jgi:hypothetical protein
VYCIVNKGLDSLALQRKNGLWSHSATILLHILHKELACQHIPMSAILYMRTPVYGIICFNFIAISSQAGIIHLIKFASYVYCYAWLKEKNILLYYNVCCGSRRSLASSCTWQGKGGGGLEVHMNLMPPRVTNISFFSVFWTFRVASS